MATIIWRMLSEGKTYFGIRQPLPWATRALELCDDRWLSVCPWQGRVCRLARRPASPSQFGDTLM